MLESIDESKSLLEETYKILKGADKLLADYHQTLKGSDELSRESRRNLVESKKLLLLSDNRCVFGNTSKA